MAKLKRELGCQVLTTGVVKKNMEYFPIPDEERWRLGFMEELLDVKSNDREIENFSHIIEIEFVKNRKVRQSQRFLQDLFSTEKHSHLQCTYLSEITI